MFFLPAGRQVASFLAPRKVEELLSKMIMVGELITKTFLS
jgi:hypothetical protein